MEYVDAIPLAQLRYWEPWGAAQNGTLLQARDLYGSKKVVIGMRCELHVTGAGPVPYLVVLSGDQVGTLITGDDLSSIAYDVNDYVDVCAEGAAETTDKSHKLGRLYEYKPGGSGGTLFVGAKMQRGSITGYVGVGANQTGVIATSLSPQYLRAIGSVGIRPKKSS